MDKRERGAEVKVLIACEESQAVCIEFRNRGHKAYSCDIQECSGGHPGWHIQGDVLAQLDKDWDLMIAHPPCTFLSYAATRVWNKPGRAEKREKAMKFFMRFINAPINKICVENPVGFPNNEYRKPDQIIHPYYFGEPYCKRTCLWLKNLPHLIHCKEDDLFYKKTHVPKPEPIRYGENSKPRQWTESFKGGDRGKGRSKTFPGIAKAMAEQWG